MLPYFSETDGSVLSLMWFQAVLLYSNLCNIFNVAYETCRIFAQLLGGLPLA